MKFPVKAVLRRANAILWIGLVAGTLDITENLVFNQLRGINPKMVFQYIASGLIGMKSFRWGLASVALGVVLHYFIALIWTAVFYVASCNVAILRRRPVICGVLHGGLVYLIMNLIVLPLSGVPRVRNAMTLASRVNGVVAVLLCIGLTIALLVSWNAARAGPSAPIVGRGNTINNVLPLPGSASTGLERPEP